MDRFTTISNDIKYIGVDDIDIDLFENQYPTPQGMSYNSYVIIDEKIAIMDTVDARAGELWLERLNQVLAGREPTYLIVHHMEPDHSAHVAYALDRWKGLKLVSTAMALKFVGQFFEGLDLTDRTIAVKQGDTLSLGKHTLEFFTAPMVHWPEVMMSYESSEKVLFSADGFGKFGAVSMETDNWADEARRYYYNICGKYGPQVQATLRKASQFDIHTICPLHGPVLHDPLDRYLGLYQKWSTYTPETTGTLIAAASIHGGTMVAAEQMKDILEAEGVEDVRLINLPRCDMSQAVALAFQYSNLLICAPSYDGDVFPVVREFIEHITMKGYCNRRVGLLENGTWAPCAARVMRSLLEKATNIEILNPVVTIRSRAHHSDIPAMQALASALKG